MGSRTHAGGFERATVFQDSDCNALAAKNVIGALWQTLDSLRPDAVCIPSWGTNYAIAALAWCLKTGTPNVVMLASSREDKARNRWTESVKSLVVKHFQAGVVGGSRQAQYLRSLGVANDRIWRGYDVIDNAHFAPAFSRGSFEAEQLRDSLGLPGRYFLSSSRFISKKNIPILIHAFARFRKIGGMLSATATWSFWAMALFDTACSS